MHWNSLCEMAVEIGSFIKWRDQHYSSPNLSLFLWASNLINYISTKLIISVLDIPDQEALFIFPSACPLSLIWFISLLWLSLTNAMKENCEVYMIQPGDYYFWREDIIRVEMKGSWYSSSNIYERSPLER